jgi:NAD(P)H-dependent flavin oxidoreductase YrpB (nitropropane dioxygenase family)
MAEVLSPPAEANLPKMQKAPAATPKRRRMASVLDADMETTKALTPALIKKVAEVAKGQAEAEPTVPIEMKAVAPEDKVDQQTSDTGMTAGQGMAEKAKSPTLKLQPKRLITFIDMLRGRNYPKNKSWKPDTMPKN